MFVIRNEDEEEVDSWSIFRKPNCTAGQSKRVLMSRVMNLPDSLKKNRSQRKRKSVKAIRSGTKRLVADEGSSNKSRKGSSTMDGLKIFADSLIQDLKVESKNLLAQFRENLRKDLNLRSSADLSDASTGRSSVSSRTTDDADNYGKDTEEQGNNVQAVQAPNSNVMHKGENYVASKPQLKCNAQVTGARFSGVQVTDGGAERLIHVNAGPFDFAANAVRSKPTHPTNGGLAGQPTYPTNGDLDGLGTYKEKDGNFYNNH